ncbi:hypothetical protein NIES4106_13060 [Fischerella sp. NIES-4106]|nr:hypothetical protein NIES4106_13060 [Fischerella sp. NIES-4106]
MNEQSASGRPKSEPLPCSAIVYRALLKKRWLNQDIGRVEAGAYLLREKEKNRGLSVNIAAICSPQKCAGKFDKCFGVASLHVGRIRELGLDVVADKYSRFQVNEVQILKTKPYTKRLSTLFPVPYSLFPAV